MAGFAHITTATDLNRVVAALRSVGPAVARAWRTEAVGKVVQPMVIGLRGQFPSGMKGTAAKASIQAMKQRQVPTIAAGKGSTQGWQPYFALEFGMSHAKVHTYIRRNRKKPGRHFVHRRTGTWAQPHRGRVGYHFWPYWESHQPELRDAAVRLIDDVVRRELS